MNIAVIQSRMGSSRLPGKALLTIGEHPLIYYVIHRGRNIKGVAQVILATSRTPENDELEQCALSYNAEVFRGDEDNVLERMYLVAQKHSAQNIIRLTGDNPLIDHNVLSFLLDKHVADQNDYSCLSGLPIGVSGDIFSFKALEMSNQNADGQELKDHVDLYVLENQDRFKVGRYKLDRNYSAYRLTVDESQDLERIQRLNDLFADKKDMKLDEVDTRDVLALMEEYHLEQDMLNDQSSVSQKNRYTGELVDCINRCYEVSLAEIYQNKGKERK